mgnify:FL=1
MRPICLYTSMCVMLWCGVCHACGGIDLLGYYDDTYPPFTGETPCVEASARLGGRAIGYPFAGIGALIGALTEPAIFTASGFSPKRSGIGIWAGLVVGGRFGDLCGEYIVATPVYIGKKLLWDVPKSVARFFRTETPEDDKPHAPDPHAQVW